MNKYFNKHWHVLDQRVGYWQHARMSWVVTIESLKVALYTFIHGFFPGFMSVDILPVHNDILNKYKAKHEEFLKANEDV